MTVFGQDAVKKYYNFVKFKKPLPASFGAAYIQVSDANSACGKEKDRAADEEEKKTENNMKELNIEQMEQVSGGKGAGWSLKDLWPKIKSWIVGDEDDD